jgi:hypothetical protein
MDRDRGVFVNFLFLTAVRFWSLLADLGYRFVQVC